MRLENLRGWLLLERSHTLIVIQADDPKACRVLDLPKREGANASVQVVEVEEILHTQ